MSEENDQQPVERPESLDPRLRPPDPAGTQPKVEPSSLLPVRRDPLLAEAVLEGTAVEVQEGDLLPDRVSRGGAVAPSHTVEAPHAARFQFILGSLIAVGVAAIALAAYALSGTQAPAGAAWSPWHPGGSGNDAVKQISVRIAHQYRLPSGHQLVAVNGGPLEVAGLPMQVVLRSDPSQSGGIAPQDGKGVLYRMCGLGPKCAIDEGQPSTERHLLLRREALELALYTFRYVDGIKQVVVFLPPPAGQDPSQALFFRPGDVAPELERPLDTVLAPHTPSINEIDKSTDAPLVNRVTSSTLYRFSLTQANTDTSVLLVLQHLPLAGG